MPRREVGEDLFAQPTPDMECGESRKVHKKYVDGEKTEEWGRGKE